MSGKRGTWAMAGGLALLLAFAAAGDGTERPFERLDVSWMLPAEDPARVVLRTAKEWESFWKERKARGVPKDGLPSPDFAEEMVIAVLMGEQPTGGYAVQVTRILETRETLEVRLRETRPGKDQIVTEALTYPACLVKTARSDKKVVFAAD